MLDFAMSNPPRYGRYHLESREQPKEDLCGQGDVQYEASRALVSVGGNEWFNRKAISSKGLKRLKYNHTSYLDARSGHGRARDEHILKICPTFRFSSFVKKTHFTAVPEQRY
jgi:hypothetical protein